MLWREQNFQSSLTIDHTVIHLFLDLLDVIYRIYLVKHRGHVLKLDAATIQGWILFEGSVYCTEAPSMWLLFNNYNLIEMKNK